ncbi:hypothetical protein HPB47_027806 [Ixodes persulcatus]|uniref:Uncharacterized protein n=1 Tax=Ixodes persulcatus TaxID=34615 RepID=A0AC60PW56_IXOPE|nr:hypothetical protein HPB47_027806 [Ixodes persulcatus]
MDMFLMFSLYIGTTGQPKPARLTHFNVVNNANTVGCYMGYHQKREIICVNGDLIYGFGRTLGVLAATMFGSTAVLPGLRYSPKATLEAIAEHRCTILTGSTTIFSDIMRELEEGAYDVSSIRKAIMSGSLCKPAIVEKMRTMMNAQDIYIMYGATETSPIFSSTNPDEPMDRWIRTIGAPLDHVEHRHPDNGIVSSCLLFHVSSCSWCSMTGVVNVFSGSVFHSVFWSCQRTFLNKQNFSFHFLNLLLVFLCENTSFSESNVLSACICESEIVPVNTSGEICTRGPHVFRGYLNDEVKTNEAIRDNWYHTGDEGTMSEDGRLAYVGRIKEMINFMGLKVCPLEVENVLNTHPNVKEAQVGFQKYGRRCETFMRSPITCGVLFFARAASINFSVFKVSQYYFWLH